MLKRFIFPMNMLVLVVLLSACQAPLAASNGQSSTPVPQISVSGTGKVYLVPDIAYVYVGIHNQAETVARAIKDNNFSGNKIKEALLAQGVDEKDIQTSSFNVYPQPEYDNMGKISRNMYGVDNTVYVTVRNLDSLSVLLDVVANSGANNINGINFDVKDRSAALDQARKLAIEDAKKQAEFIAAAAGVKLGRLMNINLYSSGASFVFEGKGGGGSAPMTTAEVPVSTGQMTISAEVNLVYEIK